MYIFRCSPFKGPRSLCCQQTSQVKYQSWQSQEWNPADSLGPTFHPVRSGNVHVWIIFRLMIAPALTALSQRLTGEMKAQHWSRFENWGIQETSNFLCQADTRGDTGSKQWCFWSLMPSAAWLQLQLCCLGGASQLYRLLPSMFRVHNMQERVTGLKLINAEAPQEFYPGNFYCYLW